MRAENEAPRKLLTSSAVPSGNTAAVDVVDGAACSCMPVDSSDRGQERVSRLWQWYSGWPLALLTATTRKTTLTST